MESAAQQPGIILQKKLINIFLKKEKIMAKGKDAQKTVKKKSGKTLIEKRKKKRNPIKNSLTTLLSKEFER
jgi:hypothetical protein